MRPILYSKNETRFDTYGLGEIDALKGNATRERNGNYTAYLEYPASGPLASVFEKEMKFKADAGTRTKNQTFEIVRVVKDSSSTIKIYAQHISHKLEYMSVRHGVKVSGTADLALKTWAKNLVGDYRFDTWSDIDTVLPITFLVDKMENARLALGGVEGSILDIWGGEYEFDNQTVRLHKRLGRRSPTVLEYGRNILSAESDESIESAYTSVVPFATYTPESQEGDSRQQDPILVTIPESYVDSKYVSMYANRRIKVVDFSGEFKDEGTGESKKKDIPTPEKLKALAIKYMESNRIGAPKINTKIEYVDLAQTLDYAERGWIEELELCDIVPVYYPEIGITEDDAKVTKVVYDFLNDRNESVEFGMIGESIRSAMTGGLAGRLDDLEKSQQSLENRQSEMAFELPKYLLDAKGNRVWNETPDENIEHKVGDIWFEKNGLYQRLYIWNGEMWEKRIDTEDVSKVGEKFDAEVKKINQSIASQAQQTAQALRTSGANASAIEAAKGAITKLNQDLTGAKTDLTQAQGQLSSNIAQIRSDVGAIRAQQTVYEQTNAQNMSRIVGQLGDKASKSEVNQTADRIREEIASQIVGGRNLLKGSKGLFKPNRNPANFDNNVLYHNETSIYMVNGQRYRISAKTDGIFTSHHDGFKESDNIVLWIMDKAVTNYQIVSDAKTGTTGTEFIWNRPTGTYHLRVNTYRKDPEKLKSVWEVKVEQGSFKTDWSPAPEDTEGLITEAKATFERTAQGLRTDLSAIQSYVNADGTRAEALRTYSRGETARQLTAERKLIEAGYVAKAQHTEDVRSISRRFEELTEGGVNLLRNSANLPTAGDYRNGKWVATSGGNGTAQIVPVTSSPSPLIKSMIRIVNNTVGNKDLSQAAMALVVGQKYTVSCYARVASDSPSPTVGLLIRSWANNNDANRKLHKTISNRDWERHSFTFTADVVANSIQFGQSGAGSVEICAPKIELGTVATSWSPSPEDATSYAETKLAEYKQNVDGQFATISQQIAGKASQTDFQHVQETSKLYERLIGSTEKEITDKVSRMALTNELFQVEVSKNLDLRTVQYQMVNAWAVQNLNSNGDIVSQINMTGPNIRIQGESIHLDGKALIDNGIIKNAMIESMLADKITAGTLNAANVNIINLNANKIVGLDANFIKSKIELAFIEWMKGKVISAQNDAMKIDLNAGQINYYTDKAALKRVLTGYPNQFVKFATGTVVGKGLAGVTIIGSNRYGSESSDDGGFVGIRAWNGPNIDQIDIVGDTVRLTSSPFESADGWDVITLPNKLEIDAHNVNHRVSSRLKVGDVWLWKNASTYSSMRETINLIIDNLQLIHNNKTTEKGYNYTMPAKV